MNTYSTKKKLVTKNKNTPKDQQHYNIIKTEIVKWRCGACLGDLAVKIETPMLTLA